MRTSAWWPILLLIGTGLCSGEAPQPDTARGAAAPSRAPAAPVATSPAPLLGYEIVDAYPHDPSAYTQGLFWHDGYLYEGTGRYNTSWLRKVAPTTGEVLQQVSLPARYFGEGIARHFMLPYNEKLWGVHPREITAAWCSRFVPRDFSLQLERSSGLAAH